MVLRENISIPLDRTPNGNILTNAGFYTFNNSEQTKLYDSELIDAEKLSGSEVVIRTKFIGSKVVMEWQSNCNEGCTPIDDWFISASDWNDARDYFIGNIDSPIKVDLSSVPEVFIQLLTNDSDIPKTFPLHTGGKYLYPWGKPVSGSVTVTPWRSVILFKLGKINDKKEHPIVKYI